MDDLFRTKGALTVSIGEGYLSSFEVSTLKKGDIVRTTKIAGYPSTILYNGTPLCPCEVVILGDLFGVRVTEPHWQEPVVPAPSTRDDLIEILPTVVSLGTIRMSLAELKTAAPGTIISLGKPFSADTDVELCVVGIPVARGKTVCLGEEMGMRVTETSPAGFAENNIRSSGYLLDPDFTAIKVKDYDFKRPDKFSKVQIDRMRDIHTLFFRNLLARLPQISPMLADQSLPPFVDQCTYGELVDELATAGKYRNIVLENAAQHGVMESGGTASYQSEHAKALLEEDGTSHPVEAASRAYIEKLHNEQGFPTRMPIIFSYEDRRVLNDMLEGPGNRDVLLACLRGGWKSVVDMRLTGVPVDDPRSQSGAIPRNEMIIVISVSGRQGVKGMLLVYPYLTLEPYLGILG
jgi:flagellar motor switch/type III secretory pathway protein FliN